MTVDERDETYLLDPTKMAGGVDSPDRPKESRMSNLSVDWLNRLAAKSDPAPAPADEARRLATEAERRGMPMSVAADLQAQPGQTATDPAENEPTNDDAAQLGDAGEAEYAWAGRRTIELTADEHIHVAEAIEALSQDRVTFQRGGQLVDVVSDSNKKIRGVKQLGNAPRIVPTPLPRLRTRLTSRIQFTRTVLTENGSHQAATHPPDWLVKGVMHAGDWPDIRHLEAVVTSPVMREDGSILQSPGYDASSGLLYEPLATYPAIPDHPTAKDIKTAVDAVLEVVQDFPFEKPAHKSAWLAATLTPLARFAFEGPSPMFVVDANTLGSGKGLLMDCAAIIFAGDKVATASYSRDDDEMEKRITSIAIAGKQHILFDNVVGTLGCASLDAAITSTKWQGRILGVSQQVEVPLHCTWYATGNNIVLGSDMARRVCHIRLNSPHERPEERDDFHIHNLLAWTKQERVRLLLSALTVLRGYVDAGRPSMGLKRWGSFDGWSDLVRQCIAWCGLADPFDAKEELRKKSDTTGMQLKAMLNGWEEVDPHGKGLTTAEVFETLEAGEYPIMRAALNEHCTGKGEKPTTRALCYLLRKFERRVIAGRYFDQVRESKAGIVWAVVRTDGGDGGDSGDPSPTPRDTLARTRNCLGNGVGSSPSPPSPPSDSLTCIHADTREFLTMDGWLRTECVHCDAVIPPDRKVTSSFGNLGKTGVEQ